MLKYDKFLLIIGILFAIVALGFATNDLTVAVSAGRMGDRFPNLVGAAASLGFSVASGLCFLASAIARISSTYGGESK